MGIEHGERGGAAVSGTGPLSARLAAEECGEGSAGGGPLVRRSSFTGWGGGAIWLVFIVLPLLGVAGAHHHHLPRGVEVGCAVTVIALYLSVISSWKRRAGGRSWATPPRLTSGLLAGLYVISGVLTLADAGSWGFLFVYCVAVATLMAPARGRLAVVIGTGGLAAAISAIAGAGGGTAFGFCVSTMGIGLLMIVMGDLRTRNAQLSQARAELARLAVTEERQRFARDLHDLLGHSLSVIALKAELAGRLLPAAPDAAAKQVADLEQVARTALGEVREAVSGYRELTLDGELAGARMALSAAGIAADVQLEPGELPGELETALAWAVREGATNAIRHSRASRCAFRVKRAGPAVALEVHDDGVGTRADALGGAPAGAGPAGRRGGHGLAGLAERARALGGVVQAGPVPGGGYRLRVEIPIALERAGEVGLGAAEPLVPASASVPAATARTPLPDVCPPLALAPSASPSAPLPRP